jgi:hypothetical protein
MSFHPLKISSQKLKPSAAAKEHFLYAVSKSGFLCLINGQKTEIKVLAE